ncbi:hypothetical protein CVT25_007069 [Psilocybe cyanescens]|uniref:Uncharacterized protein n=1 Tax=Psilocybe cyanescens TaxID=93625 RepID=A0A409XH37_PSICY|nr:hypothetical protein CVT25_007069 [Psilocybe cyanescens]
MEPYNNLPDATKKKVMSLWQKSNKDTVLKNVQTGLCPDVELICPFMGPKIPRCTKCSQYFHRPVVTTGRKHYCGRCFREWRLKVLPSWAELDEDKQRELRHPKPVIVEDMLKTGTKASSKERLISSYQLIKLVSNNIVDD